MPLYRVHGKVTGSKYMGEYEASTPEEAEAMAYEEEGCCCLCHRCTSECEDAEVEVVSVEEVEDEEGA